MQLWPIVKGMATWIPGLYKAERGTTGGTQDARYCYAVWMRHLLGLTTGGMPMRFQSVAEIGPGDSLGIGIAALLSGASRLQAFDVVSYASTAHNVTVLQDLATLFRARAPIPGVDEFPGVFPRIDRTPFPAHLWRDGELDRLVADDRVRAIAAALRGHGDGAIEVTYQVPWDAVTDDRAGSVDIVFSQAVLEHVDDLASTHAALGRWLAPGGHASHVIDLRSHHITPGWDGHLQYPARIWQLVRGNRPYLLNRRSPSEHLAAMTAHGFELLDVQRDLVAPTVPAQSLAAEFRGRNDEDRATASMRVIARRPLPAESRS